jgi:hypothetical protein
MSAGLRYGGQTVVYGLICLLIGYFANAPTYTRVPADLALLKLSFAHGARSRGECRRLSREELENLAPNMRKPVVCPRERLPVAVELEVDGRVLYAATLPPTGLSGDGPSRAYERFVLPAGRHRVVARLRDSARAEGFDYVSDREIELAPGQSLAIDFAAVSGGFRFE